MSLAALLVPPTETERLKLRLAEAIDLLRPFAKLAEVCDHFNHPDGKPMCSYAKDGVRWNGPSAADCRKARDFIQSMEKPK